jgi:hypothetical protein
VHHGSFSSGLDFLTASAEKTKSAKKKNNRRMSSSYGSGLDFLSAMGNDVTDDKANQQKKGRRKNSKREEGESNRPSLDDLLGETVELDEDDSSMGSSQGGGSVCTLGTIADRRKQFELDLKQSGISESEAFKGDNEEDIFTFYSWSSSRQSRPKIQRERKLLQDAMKQSAVLDTKEALIRQK